jgi:hypothetical protein
MSIESTETVYVRFDFEPELLSGRVYERSYKYLAKQLARRGKDVLPDARADLFIRERGGKGDGDEVSILSVSRYDVLLETNPSSMDAELKQSPKYGNSYPDFQEAPTSTVRPLSRRVLPGLPRPATFKRQQSELRDRLEPVKPAPEERRAISLDRRRRIVQVDDPRTSTDTGN